jgi:hypothetical protein
VVSQFVINHICKEFANGEDIGDALESRSEVDFDAHKPRVRLSSETDSIQRYKSDMENEKIFGAQVKVYVECQAMYESNKQKALALIYEQYHKGLQGKLKAWSNYDTHIKGDPIALINAIQEHTMSHQENRYDATIVLDPIQHLTGTEQQDDKDLVEYTR